ncbi:hypothetical protein IWX90DRAFT_156109 [Phyllosticta citrichinensis]|uniref:Uncharacterized protein n=1 Tax=Phyllosticta citrichinensis TaxID=1130410 RepID=A0ABR1XZZ1_9PEZI
MASCRVESSSLLVPLVKHHSHPVVAPRVSIHSLRPKTDNAINWSSLEIEAAHWQPRAMVTARGNLTALSHPQLLHFSPSGNLATSICLRVLYWGAVAAVRPSFSVIVRCLSNHPSSTETCALPTDWLVNHVLVSLDWPDHTFPSLKRASLSKSKRQNKTRPCRLMVHKSFSRSTYLPACRPRFTKSWIMSRVWNCVSIFFTRVALTILVRPLENPCNSTMGVHLET